MPSPLRFRLSFGRDKESVASALYDLLSPGGYILVYNVSIEPSPSENALERDLWEGAGFEIHAFDLDDRGVALGIGRELGWEAHAMPLDENIRSMYTLLQRRAAP